jgi:hypothetical protein
MQAGTTGLMKTGFEYSINGVNSTSLSYYLTDLDSDTFQILTLNCLITTSLNTFMYF